MILSGEQIKRERINDRIHISPFVESAVKTNSLDVHLGAYFWLLNDSDQDFDFGSESDMIGRWKYLYNAVNILKGPIDPLTHDTLVGLHPLYQKARDAKICIPPGQIALCHTIETVGAWEEYVPKMRVRSTVARAGLLAVGGAGMGDVGFVGRWAFPVFNPTNHWVYIPVGFRIAQIYFECLVSDTPRSYAEEGNYGSQGPDRTLRRWNPLEMLPKNSMSLLDMELGTKLGDSTEHVKSIRVREPVGQGPLWEASER